MKRNVVKVVAILLSLILLAGASFSSISCAPEVERPEEVTITMVTAQAGGSLYMQTEILAEAMRRTYPDWRVSIISGFYSPTFIDMAAKGTADVFKNCDPLPLCKLKEQPFYGGIEMTSVELAMIALMDVIPFQFVCPEELPINSFYELKEKQLPLKIGFGWRGTCVGEPAITVFEAYGITLEDIEAWGGKVMHGSATPFCDMLADGLLDAIAYCTSIPNVDYERLSMTKDVKLISVTEPEIIEKLKKEGMLVTESLGPACDFTPEELIGVATP